MANTQVFYSGLLATVDAQLSALAVNPQVDYQVGNVRISASQKLKQLMDMREMIITRMKEKPFESIEVIQSDFSVFGQDLSSFIGEDP